MGGVAQVLHGVAPGRRLVGRGGTAATIAARPRATAAARRHRAMDAVDPGRAPRDLRRGGLGHERLDRGHRALADARALERVEALLGRPGLRDRVGVGVAEMEVRRGPEQATRTARRPGRRPSGGGRRPPTSAARKGVARCRAGAAGGPCAGRPWRRMTGSSVIATSVATSGMSMPAVAHAAQERQRQHDQREQADGDGRAREDDRAPRGRHGRDDRLVALQAALALLAPADDDRAARSRSRRRGR